MLRIDEERRSDDAASAARNAVRAARDESGNWGNLFLASFSLDSKKPLRLKQTILSLASSFLPRVSSVYGDY